MTNEEALQILKEHNKWRREGDTENLVMYEPKIIGEAIDVAIAYMQEQSEPVAYGVMMPDGRIDKSDEPFYFADEIERKLANCIEGCTIAKFYTTPQRQQPLKRLSDEQVELIATNDMFWEANGFSSPKLKWDEFANAIMDEMERINK